MVNCQLRPYTDLNVSLILAGFMPNEYCLSRDTKDSLYFAGGINSLLVRKGSEKNIHRAQKKNKKANDRNS